MPGVKFNATIDLRLDLVGAVLEDEFEDEAGPITQDTIEKYIRNNMADFIQYGNLGKEEWNPNRVHIFNVEENNE